MKRRLLWTGVGLFAMLLFAVAACLYMLQTDWFKNKVRQRIITVAEQATGGRVEIGAFSYDWRRLTATVAPFVLHGTEPAGTPPLLRADRIEIGIRIISALERRIDLDSVVVERPHVHIITSADGRTNIPKPRIQPRGESFVQDLLDLKVREVGLRNGDAEYNGQRVPFDLDARDLNAHWRYESAGPRYTGEIVARALTFNRSTFGFHAKIALQNDRLQIADAELRMRRSRISVQGSLDNFVAPRGAFEVNAQLFPAELIPGSYRGEVTFQGKASIAWHPALEYLLDGNVTAHGLAYADRFVTIDSINVASHLKLTPDRLELTRAAVNALGGVFHGNVDVRNFKTLLLDGTAEGFPLDTVARATGRSPGQFAGIASGPVHIEARLVGRAVEGATVRTKLEITPGAGATPVQGRVDATYDQRSNTLHFGDSNLVIPTGRAEFSGTPGERFNVRGTLWGMPPGLPPLPIILKGGTARFDGAVTGPLNNPTITGHIEATRFTVRQQNFDRASADIVATKSDATVRGLTLDQGALHISGDGRVTLAEWQLTDDSTIRATGSVSGADLKSVAAQLGFKTSITGTFSATGEMQGTLRQPHIAASVDARNVTAFEQKAERIIAGVRLAGDRIAIEKAHITAGGAEIGGSGAYQAVTGDWDTGELQFEFNGHSFTLAQITAVHKQYGTLDAQVTVNGHGSVRVVKGAPNIQSLNGSADLRNVTVDKVPYGTLQITLATKGSLLDVNAKANLRGTALEGSGEWRLEGEYPGKGELVIPRMTVATLHGLVPNATRAELPFEGFIEGRMDLSGPLKNPDQLKAEVRLTTVQINARQAMQPRAGARSADLVLHNAQPVVLDVTTKAVNIRSTQFTGTDSTLGIEGRMSLDAHATWDMKVNGAINLAVLQIFNPSLLGSGNAVVNVAVRGALTEPDVTGQLQLRNASLYLADLPNGVSQANGQILFDRNRATIDRLSAVSGGGRVEFQRGSFVGFRGPALLYHVQATADHVRYRSPEGISITANGDLSLQGTSENSVLSGTITVTRAGFNPKTDVGGLLASTTKPIATPSEPNQYLRGLQFDVRVESAANLEIETYLTRNIEASSDVRVKGTPDHPVVLGHIGVNRGEIEFFGNRYSINRGEVNFYNTAKIEPVIDMDLETVVRGITVDVAFSGALNKLNFSYRSDPPLQSNDIIALLAVGREPITTGGLASAQTSGNFMASGANDLLGQALSPPAAGRLQRFFGVSHLRIDPLLTDITSIPQARVTLEQQISKDVTLTYITNLTRTQEQIVRIEWNLSRQWSVIALRDENGAFGIDFQVRRRFK